MDENKNRENFFSEDFSFEKNDEKDSKGKKEKSAVQEIFEWVACIGIAFVVAFVLKTYVMTIAVVDGPSMENTLHHAERLITWKMGYKPERGDVVIFQPKKSTSKQPVYYVKRIIATEHDDVVVDYNQNAVFVNGKKVEEDYIKDEVMLQRGSGIENGIIKVVVPEDHVYVLGDNRNNSEDSRSAAVGCVPHEDIEGKVVFRFWPLNKIGTVE